MLAGFERRRAEVHGPRHPHTLTLINNLGSLLQARGELEEAEPLYREALVASREVLGPRHPSTLKLINRLGRLLKARGELEEAEALMNS